MIDMTQVLGWIATFLFSIMIVPQMIKTIREKNVDGVSLFLFIIYLIANIFALVYAFLIVQPPLIFKYIVGIGTTVIYLFLFFYYLKNREK
jgi:uncharacterized protein with PQ loop repeat